MPPKDNNLTVEQIFVLQDRCLGYSRPLVEDRFVFVKECIELIINRHIDEEVLTKNDGGK